MSRRLYRSRREQMISGVAGGVAECLDIDPSIVRILWAVLAIASGGILLLVYILMWIVVPEAADAPMAGAPDAMQVAPSAPASRRDSGAGGVVFGAILIATGAAFLAREFVPELDLERYWPLALVALGALLLVAGLRRRAE